MISWLSGKIFEKADHSVILDVQGVGYEVSCSLRVIESLEEKDSPLSLYIHTHYKTDGVALFGFLTKPEKDLFLMLLKVDSVGPKSALNILSAGTWQEIAELIEEGDVASLSKLPKVSKKTAEHLVVKLKGKLSDLLLSSQVADLDSVDSVEKRIPKLASAQKIRSQAQSALIHLGYKPHEVERALSELEDKVWTSDLQSIIRFALNDLSGNNL